LLVFAAEEELLESTALLLQSSSALTSDEQMMLGGGFYGDANPTGSYGGLFDDWGNQLNQEAAASSPSSMTTTTPAPVQTKAASSAMPADKSMAMLVAGAMVAVSALLL
jgi:hypothetical protein